MMYKLNGPSWALLDGTYTPGYVGLRTGEIIREEVSGADANVSFCVYTLPGANGWRAYKGKVDPAEIESALGGRFPAWPDLVALLNGLAPSGAVSPREVADA